METPFWWHEEGTDCLLQVGQLCSARPSRTRGITTDQGEEDIPTAASTVTCWKTQGKQGGAGGVELERTQAQHIWEVGGCTGDIAVSAKVGMTFIDVLSPNHTPVIAALVASGRQLLFGMGMRRVARVPPLSWCPRVVSATQNRCIVLGVRWDLLGSRQINTKFQLQHQMFSTVV